MRLAVAFVAVALTATALPAAAQEGGDGRTRVYLLTRAPSVVTAVKFTVEMVAEDAPGTVMYVGSRRRAGVRVAGNALLGEFAVGAEPVVYGANLPTGCGVSSCPRLLTPRDAATWSLGSGDTDETLDLWLVAVRADSARLSVKSKGWRVQRLSASLFRTAHAATSEAFGTRIAGRTAERFQRASLPGGPHGSFGVAHPPCEAVGTGEVTFSGGATTWPLDCSPGAYLFKVEQARSRTLWRLEGDMVGETSDSIRLAVLDLPDPRVCGCR
jgi:hypothetical protein